MSKGDFVALAKCFFCGESGDLLIHKSMRDISAINGKVIHMEPCSKCKEYMKQGIIFITIDSAKSDANWHVPPANHDLPRINAFGREIPGSARGFIPNPYRTGGFFVVKEEAVRKFTNEPMLANVLKHRWTFIEHEVAVKIGMIKETGAEKH
jgi:hypothetical protein